MTLKKIITDRLYLIPFTIEICEELLQGNTAILSQYGLKPSIDWPDEDMLETLPRIITNLEKVTAPSGFESWMIIKKENDTIIGDIGFKGVPNLGSAVDIGYGITLNERRKGYASEAIAGLIQWAFSQPSVKLITAQSLLDNTGSAKILEKQGFKKTGILGEFIQWRLVKKKAV